MLGGIAHNVPFVGDIFAAQGYKNVGGEAGVGMKRIEIT
jgi:hypothetical protein